MNAKKEDYPQKKEEISQRNQKRFPYDPMKNPFLYYEAAKKSAQYIFDRIQEHYNSNRNLERILIGVKNINYPFIPCHSELSYLLSQLRKKSDTFSNFFSAVVIIFYTSSSENQNGHLSKNMVLTYDPSKEFEIWQEELKESDFSLTFNLDDLVDHYLENLLPT